MEIGPFIKLHRIEQNMTQEDLSKGIVSMSYLSKIENERTVASPEVIRMLCTRLGIQLNSKREAVIQKKCKKWYKLLYEVTDKEEIIKRHQEIRKLVSTTYSYSFVMFEIHRIRYFLVLREYSKALQQINKLNEISSTFDTLQQYYWFKFKGNYSSLKNESNEAIRLYKKAENLFSQLDLSEDEKADLQYTIAVTYSKLRNTLESIKYAEKALDTFMKKYNFIRCAECHIILGIAYRRIKMYEKSIKNHNLAKRLGNLIENKQIIQLANQNLGVLHSTKGEREDAIYHYSEVIKHDKTDLNARLTAVTSLIKEYYAIEEYDKAELMIYEGLKLLEQSENVQSLKLHYYVIHTYHYAIKEDGQNFKSLVINEFIPYLKKHKDFGNIVLYATMLGEYFEKIHKYKNATKYYKLANKTYESLITL